MVTRHGPNEPFYLYCSRYMQSKDILIYPNLKNSRLYIEVNISGWLWISNDSYKPKAIYKKDKDWAKEILKLYQTFYIMNKHEKAKNILEEAAEILYNRDADKAKDYGPFHDAMARAAKVFSLITGKHLTTREFYIAMMSLKLTRLKHSDKYDTYLDLIAYIASASELKNEPEHIKFEDIK